MNLNVASDEAALLAEILSSYLSELRMEISHTDRMDYRDGLKKKEIFIKKLLRELGQAAA